MIIYNQGLCRGGGIYTAKQLKMGEKHPVAVYI